MSLSPGERDPFAQGIAESLEAESPGMAAAVMAELKRGWMADHVLAGVRQKRIAAATDRIERAGVDGMGQLTMRIDPHAYHYWGQRLGYECWHDKQFREEFKRDNPEVRVRNRTRKETIVKSREVKPGAIVAATKRGTVVPVS